MKFFNIDCHVSVIGDVAHIFNNLGHQVDDWSLSGHSWVLNKPKMEIVLNDGTRLLGGGVSTEENCDKFYETFKDEFEKYDGFICCYPAEFALLFEKWNKPIIIVNCVRYEHPNTRDHYLWGRLDIFLKKWNDLGKLFYVCNNKGDQWYTEYYTGIKGEWIPSLCQYTNCEYVGDDSLSLIAERSILDGIPHNLAISISSLKNREWRLDWKDVYRYSSVIHVAYHNGSMSIFEHYTANMPMFMPSKEFGKHLYHNNLMFSDLTFYKINNLPEPDDMNNPNRLSNPDILNKWFDTCDFYDQENMPYIIYFDSFEDLRNKLYSLKKEDYLVISQNMKQYNESFRIPMVYNKWINILENIKKVI